jgi:serine/threonine protein kinase
MTNMSESAARREELSDGGHSAVPEYSCPRVTPDDQNIASTLLRPLKEHPHFTLVAGDLVGENYEIVRPLASGGMGQVYVARHLRLQRDVALKVILAQFVDHDAAKRFEREMLAAGRLDHPNLVRATDAGESRGRLFLVMDLVPGCDVGRLVTDLGPLRVADACELARQIAVALQAVFKAKLVHRDIKPSNVMLTPDGVVKVLDLGLARLVEDSSDSLTEVGSLAGTLDYMAPEQALDARAVTIAADVYSLGCTLYCLLAGRPPFGDPEHRSATSKLRAHNLEAVPAITTFRPELAQNPGLVRLLDQMLAKDPADRPAEPQLVAEALTPLARDHSVHLLLQEDRSHRTSAAEGTSSGPGQRKSAVTRWRKLFRIRVVASAIAGLALVAMLIFPGQKAARNADRSVKNSAPTVPDVEAAGKGELRLESFEISHYLGNTSNHVGMIGQLSKAAKFGDNVRVRIRLSAPAYCYLLALNPDGSMQYCPKALKNTPPVKRTEIIYPAEADGYYGLTDGTGLQAFALIASREALPAFGSWPQSAALRWKPAPEATGVWRFDGRDFNLLAADTRGTERRVASSTPEVLTEMCSALCGLTGVDVVEAVAFPVEPQPEDQRPESSK